MKDRKGEAGQSPKTADEQGSPQPVRPTNPQEEAGQSIQDLEDPPQAEGDRESAEK